MKDNSSNVNEPNIQSVSRAVQILKCFRTQHQMTLTEIGKAAGLHKSTTYGIVTTLKNEGFYIPIIYMSYTATEVLLWITRIMKKNRLVKWA